MNTHLSSLTPANTLLARIHKTLDLVLVVLSFVAAYQLKRNFIIPSINGLSTQPNYYLVLLIIVLLAPFFFWVTGFYQSYRSQPFYDIAIRVAKAVIGILFGTIIVLFLLHESDVSRLLLVIFSFILSGLLLLSKSLLYFTLQRHRARDYNTRNVLIIGTGHRAKRMIKSLQRRKGSGYRIMGCLDPSNGKEKMGSGLTNGHSGEANAHLSSLTPPLTPSLGDISILGSINMLPTMLVEEIVDEVIFAADLGDIENINEYIRFAEGLGINIHIVPDFQLEKIMYRPETATVYMDEFAGLPTIAISTIPQRHGELLIKSGIDYFAAVAGLVVLSPLFLAVILLVKMTSKGPAFFIQERCGLYGRTFKLFKFRTMVANAEELKKGLEQKNEVEGPVFKISKDPRITPIGRFLRKTSIDELPQLINILMGQMSLVGPRPPIPAEVKQYDSWQRRRLSMKPGITGIWQVSGRNNIEFERWMRLDLEYIDNWSLLLDFKILLKTVKEVLSCSGN